MGHAYKHRLVKAELVKWLRTYGDEAFWQQLARFAGKDWRAFAKCVRQAWQNAGGNANDLSFLDNSQHTVNVWQLVNRKNVSGPKPKKTFSALEKKAELIDWLWYNGSDQFWAECPEHLLWKDLRQNLRPKLWKDFAARVKREWSAAGGDVTESARAHRYFH